MHRMEEEQPGPCVGDVALHNQQSTARLSMIGQTTSMKFVCVVLFLSVPVRL